MNYTYFSQEDFDTCNPPCKIDQMNPDTLRRFDEARELAGIPFKINCAYRTVDHEKKMGRAGTSSHTKGKAMDIACTSSNARYKILNALKKAGFTRIGVANTFIHADDDADKPQNVIWTYP
jgi:uncharacterized protein YcbK (DUF882 family)